MRNTFKRPSQLPRMKNNSGKVLQMSYLTNCDFHINTNSKLKSSSFPYSTGLLNAIMNNRCLSISLVQTEFSLKGG